jgi:beta-lactamase superfamily II metal-dependent hydrolase
LTRTSTDWTRPAADVFEVSIFGPGKGESVLVHLGGDDWMLVDSCIDQVLRVSPALEYLEGLGVEVSQRVRVVVGTHAHDDHIAGLGDFLIAAKSAIFVCSSALTGEEFFAQVEADADIEAKFRQSVRSEYRKILEEVAKRGRRDPKPWILRAVEQRLLWERPAKLGLPGARVIALSPSDRAVSRATSHLAAGTAHSSDRRRLATADPNELAVALWVELGDRSALLGADLLVGPAGCGWGAVLASFVPDSAGSLIKVPHHGSPNADHPDVWQRLLAEAPTALVAPYRGGRRPRPDTQDVARLCGVASELWSTAAPGIPANPRRVKGTAAALATIASNVREPWGRCGQVRARAVPAAAGWSVDVAPPARPLCRSSAL